ncbi:MAG: hypothetical protein QM718_01785 [Steroidobacteraceae bacterium]
MLWSCILLPPLERAALQRLGWWAQQWSSAVSIATQPDARRDQAALWLEIGASLKLFGGLPALQTRIATALQELECNARLGWAPTPAAALLRARAGCTQPCLTLPELQQSWRLFRLRWLALPEPTLAALHDSGLRRIDEVLALEAAALARRFGPQTSHYLQRLQGLQADPLPLLGLPQQYRSRCEFPAEIQHSSALLFPLQRLLGEFQGYLRARDRAVQDFTLTLEHPRSRTRPIPDTVLGIGLAQPERAAAQLLTLLRHKLERTMLPAPVRAVRIEARRFSAPAILQGDLFERSAEQPQQFHQTCDRLRARLGADALLRAELQADHRPERAFRYDSNNEAADASAGRNGCAATMAARPCVLLPEPQLLAGTPTLLSGPERIESGWWSGTDCVRDYFVAHDAQGARLWVFREAGDQRWYLHGLWS